MTDISKEAVEVLARIIGGRSPNNTEHDQTRAANTLIALQARVEELEEHISEMLADQDCACGHDNPSDICRGHLPRYKRDVAAARLQGLRDAADWIDEMRISNRTAAVNGLRAKALKETGQ